MKYNKAVTGIFLMLFIFTTKIIYAQNRPNIIFIYTDDQRYDALGLVQEAQAAKARFPWFTTPNIDRLGKEGVLFSNSFVVNSLCSPSRASFLTGEYNHVNEMTNNHTEYHSNDPTYATELRKAGYHTAFIGKWHMANQRGKRPGFDYSYSFVGQGRYMDCPFELNGQSAKKTKGWVDDVSTDTAMAYIKRNSKEPFMLALAFKSSHGKWVPPARLMDSFSHVSLIPAVNEHDEPPYKGKVYNPPRRKDWDAGDKSESWTKKNDEIIRNYFRVLKAVDENVGKILDLLDSLNLTGNTAVIFSSDNGYLLGEHHLGDKRAAYEESMRTPLLVRYPALFPKGRKVDEFVLNVDIAPTILDLAGVKAPQSFQGKSWVDLAAGKKVPWRKSFLYEYFYENNFNTPTIVALRTQNAKLVTYPGQPGWTELFDLTKDKAELNNLYKDSSSAYLKYQMVKQLKAEEKAYGFKIPAVADKPALDADGHYLLEPNRPNPLQKNKKKDRIQLKETPQNGRHRFDFKEKKSK